MIQSRPSLSVIGIDPGADGAAVILTLQDKALSLQTIRFKSHHKSPPDWVRVFEKLQTVFNTQTRPPVVAVYMEKVGGRPGRPASTEFAFGENVGRVKMLLDLLQVQTHFVYPQTWQALMFAGLDRGETGNKDKRLTHEAIARFFPNLNVPHDGIADAILLALFGGIMEGLIVNPFTPAPKEKKRNGKRKPTTNFRATTETV